MTTHGERNQSFENAVISGAIKGPDWPVINSETGIMIEPGDQDFRGQQKGRSTGRVVTHCSGVIGTVEDFQFPADTDPEKE